MVGDSSIGNRIKECRIKAGLTQQELADRLNSRGLNTDRSTISKWETGYQEPTLTPLKYIAEILGVTLDYLNNDNGVADIITRQSLKDDEKILLDLWGEIGDEERDFFKRQLERAAKERKREDYD